MSQDRNFIGREIMLSPRLIRPRGRVPPSFGVVRCFSASADAGLVLTTMDEASGVAMLVMNRPPANSLSLEMNRAISRSIRDVENNNAIHSLIIASSSQRKIFCAGLDVAELLAPDKDRLPRFWRSLQQVYIDLYGSRLATVAAVDGHAPAAGCFLAMSCDFRVMSGEVGRIGLNETRLGIAAPPWMGQMLVRLIGHRRGELALALGTLFEPEDAMRLGLIDEVIYDSPDSPGEIDEESRDILENLLPSDLQYKSSDSLLQRALKQAREFAEVPSNARTASKMITRKSHLRYMVTNREADTDWFCEFINQTDVQENLRRYVKKMKKSKSKK